MSRQLTFQPFALVRAAPVNDEFTEPCRNESSRCVCTRLFTCLDEQLLTQVV